jgi:hypothetical protein
MCLRASDALCDRLPGSPVPASLLLDPLADICRAILQRDAPGFAARKVFHGISIDERHILQIQNQTLIARFQREEPVQLRYMFRLDATTQGIDDLPVRRPLDS